MLRTFFVVSAASFLVGCAGISPSTLKPVSDGRSITLKFPVKYEEYYSFAGNRFKYTIRDGKYFAAFEDDGGVYYEGNDKCFVMEIEPDGKPPLPLRAFRCGIILVKASSTEPILYMYRVSDLADAEVKVNIVDKRGLPTTSPAYAVGGALGMEIVRALDAAEIKNLHIYKDQPKPGQIRQALE